MLVVTVLIAIMTYQVLIILPGRVWHGDPTLLVHSRTEETDKTLFYVGLPVLAEKVVVWGMFLLLNTTIWLIID